MATGIEIVGGVAACIEVVRFGKSIIEFISDINEDRSEIEDTLLYFKNTINGIVTVFDSIHGAIENQGLDDSDTFVKIVWDYGEHCAYLLKNLKNKLPELSANPGAKQKVWAALKQRIRGNVIQEQVVFLQRYMQITQMALWGIESRQMSRQDTKIDRMHEMLSELAALPPYSPNNPDDGDYDRLKTNIDKIRDVATRESSVYDLVMEPVPVRRVETQVCSSGLDNLPQSVRELLIEDRTLSMPVRPTAPSRNDPVEALERRGMFLRAANEVSHHALSHEEEMEQEERRADLLLKCATIRPHQRALGILNRLWESESQQAADSISPKRLGELGSKVARLSLDSKRLGHFTEQERTDDRVRAISVLDRSMKLLLDNLEKIQPYPYKTLLSVGELLIHILKETGNATFADKTGNSLRRKLGDLGGNPCPIPHDWPHKFMTKRSEALDWCEPANLVRLHDRWPETPTIFERPDLFKLRFKVRSADFRFDAPAEGISPIHLAVVYEEKEILAEMLGDVEDIKMMNSGPPTPLMEAAMKGNEEIVKLLLTHEAQVNCVDAQQRTALHWAQIGNGYNAVGIAQSILAAPQGNSILEKKDVDGKTALYLACKMGNGDMVELLVTKHKARVSVKDVYCKTALHATVEAQDRPDERLRIVQILLEARADPNTSDNSDRTPLCIACSRGNYDLARLLLDHGAGPNRRGPDGQTPLIVATRRNHVNIVLELLQKGAQPTLKDAGGQSALGYAERTRMTSEIHNLLRGGNPTAQRQRSFASSRSGPFFGGSSSSSGSRRSSRQNP
ncbi:hypothetical protein PG985_005352 [Apiospora marii]|uniref:Fungal N-terminal domain-containing protein n=1 Tax=Apiospora marii TaxID=335849 RepID=A0ABR1SBP1_9PEZI